MKKEFAWNAIEATEEDLRAIRALPDFELAGLLSEIHGCGWPVARKLLAIMREQLEAKARNAH